MQMVLGPSDESCSPRTERTCKIASPCHQCVHDFLVWVFSCLMIGHVFGLLSMSSWHF